MDFFDRIRMIYSPKMTRKEFSDAINDVENELFNEHPEYLELSENIQNHYVEEAYKRSGYVNHNKNPI